MHPILTTILAIMAASALCVILFGIWQCLTPCGWHRCPECSWFQHDSGLYSQDEPDGWDGVLSERICTSCASIERRQDTFRDNETDTWNDSPAGCNAGREIFVVPTNLAGVGTSAVARVHESQPVVEAPANTLRTPQNAEPHFKVGARSSI